MTPQSTPSQSAAPEYVAPAVEFARSLTGGVIMDVVTPEQARIAAEAGA
ncbi:MAG TPA: pyridoxal 5'-phosphate synthase lyase subunit PdxS, partial [Brevibacterium senegalense]|nr:pyridoxal 5'-phosphate synthase lyase subunit PdxS [Brevibacterium senegalense]